METAQFITEYETNYEYVLRFILRLMRSAPQLAEDISAETWMKAWRFRDQWKGDSTFRTWVCRIALNQIRIEWRKTNSPMRRGDKHALPLQFAFKVHDPSGNPERHMSAEQLVARVRFSDRRLLERYHIDGEQVDAIAENLGWSIGKTKTRIFRAREAARELIGAL